VLTSVKLALNEPQVHSQSSVKRQKQLCIGLAHSDSRDSSVEYIPSLIADTSFPVSRLPSSSRFANLHPKVPYLGGNTPPRKHNADSHSSAFSSWSLSPWLHDEIRTSRKSMGHDYVAHIHWRRAGMRQECCAQQASMHIDCGNITCSVGTIYGGNGHLYTPGVRPALLATPCLASLAITLLALLSTSYSQG
jgi:hypothetical protein